jgi:hypothetical protein
MPSDCFVGQLHAPLTQGNRETFVTPFGFVRKSFGQDFLISCIHALKRGSGFASAFTCYWLKTL